MGLRGWAVVWLAVASMANTGCGSGDENTSEMGPSTPVFPASYPRVDELPEQPDLPDLFTSFDGSQRASDVASWELGRRLELINLFSFYVYGYIPEKQVPVTATAIDSVGDFVPNLMHYREVQLQLGDLGLQLHVSLFTPEGVSEPPVFIAPNRCGNQEVTVDPRVRATTAWIGDNCGVSPQAARGVRADQWPLEKIVASGFAFATFHESEIDPDDDDDSFENGVHAVMPIQHEPDLRWGRIAAWAWGVSRVVDWLERSGQVDPDRIAVVGHSRRGKTALLASALDSRINMAIAHQSGTGGAALTRHLEGESVAAINLFFPAWFNDVFPTFADNELRLPVDQHMLIALSAPRLVLATDGDGDFWADPEGSRQAVDAARGAWELYGEGQKLSYRTRPGGHDLTHDDWDMFLDYARSHWP